MERFWALLALCKRNPPVTGEFSPQRPVTQSFNIFIGVRLNKHPDANDLKRYGAHCDVILMIFDTTWRNRNALHWEFV